MRTFSIPSFIIGVLTGFVAMGLIFWGVAIILFGSTSVDSIGTRAVLNTTHEIITDAQIAQASRVYGQVRSINEDTLVVAIDRGDTVEIVTFRHDANTAFVTHLNDEDSTEVSITRADIMVDDYVTVEADNKIRGNDNLFARQIVKF